VTLLAPGEVRARRRPLLIAAIFGMRLLAGLCLAWPLASLVAASGIGAHPNGDRSLFENGGYLLLDLLRAQGGALLATTRGLLPSWCFGLLLTGGTNAALWVALNESGPFRAAELCRRALTELPRLLLVGGAATLAQLALCLLGASLASAVPESLARPISLTLTQGGVWLVTAVLVGAIGGLSDVTKAALVRHRARPGEALARALGSSRRRPLGVYFGWLPYAMISLGAAVLGAELTEVCDVSGPGAWRVASVFALHQLVILSGVAARAAWFARALRLAATLTAPATP